MPKSMNKKITVRPMNISEVDSVSDLIRNVISGAKHYNSLARKTEISKYLPDKVEEIYQKDKLAILAAFLEQELVGFCVSHFDDYTIWIDWFGVAPEASGHGISKTLLKYLEKTAPRRKAHKIWCDSRTTNTIANNTLIDMGYKKIITIQKHWYRQDFMLWQKFILKP